MKYETYIPGKFTDYCRHPEEKVVYESSIKRVLVNGDIIERTTESYFCTECNCTVYPIDEVDTNPIQEIPI